MPYTDIAIFIAFLLVNLIVGLKYRGKTKSFQEYAIGDKKFSTGTLTATIVATWASGSLFFNDIEYAYSDGLYYIIPGIVGGTLGLLITGYLLGPRLAPFLKNVSMAEAMSSIYGKEVQTIAALSSVLTSIGYIAIQFKVIGKTLTALFNYQGSEITIIAAAIIIFYSAFGGVKSVTFTDVVQFITFGTLLPVLALVIWHSIQNPQQVIHTLTTNTNFNFKHVVSWTPKFRDSIVLMLYFMTPGLPPQLFQRMAMARDIKQVKQSFAYSTGILLLIELLLFWIAILLLSDNPSIKAHGVVEHMIQQYTYTGLKGFLGIGVIALAMSTADSALNSCAVLVTNDILPPLKITKQASVYMANITTFVIGFLAISLTLSIQNILKILLLSANFYIPILTAPMLLTIFGFRTSKRSIFIGMGAGFLITMFLLIYFQDVNSLFPGMFTNLAFLLGSHYLLKAPGGWEKQPIKISEFSTKKSYTVAWTDKFKTLKNFKLQAYLEKNLPNKEYYYPLFAFYLLTATYLSLYHLPHRLEKEYLTLYRIIQYSVLVITTSLLTFPIWPQYFKNKRIMAWLWPGIIFYTLFFVGSILVIMNEFNSNQLLILMLNIIMTVLLTYWPLALSLTLGGFLSAIGMVKLILGAPIVVSNSLPIAFQLTYSLLLFSSFLIALFRFKQANKELEDKHAYLRSSHQETIQDLLKSRRHEERFIKALNTEGVEELNYIVSLSKHLQSQASNLPKQLFPDNFLETLTIWQEKLTAIKHYLKILAHRTSSYLRLEVRQESLATLLRHVTLLLQLQEVKELPQINIQNHSKFKDLQIDTSKIKQLLIDGILYAQTKQLILRTPILLGVKDTLLSYPISSIAGHSKQVPALCFIITTAQELPNIQPIYLGNVDQAYLWNGQIQEDLTLSTNQRVIEAHYGHTSLEINDGSITQLYVIPVQVREVRPQDMDNPQIDIDAEQPIVEENYPGAAEQEKAFLEAVKTGTRADLALVEKALRLIKKYHAPVKRKSGEPFYLHPLAAAMIVMQYTTDPDTIISALLHDIVEDTALSLPQIGLMFNNRVQSIVDGVTHLDSNFNTLYKVKLAAHENIQQLLEIQDKRVLYVKLADRLHNMRTIQYHSSLAKQKQIADETLKFFVPMAQHLGIKEIMEELKNISLEVINKQE
jgi:Na+/proline symporter